jgi:hypothetical protein
MLRLERVDNPLRVAAAVIFAVRAIAAGRVQRLMRVADQMDQPGQRISPLSVAAFRVAQDLR